MKVYGLCLLVVVGLDGCITPPTSSPPIDISDSPLTTSETLTAVVLPLEQRFHIAADQPGYDRADLIAAVTTMDGAHYDKAEDRFYDEFRRDTLEVRHWVVDLNDDGRNELLVELSSEALYGKIGSGVGVFVHGPDGDCCRMLLQQPGSLTVLDSLTAGYPDLQLTSPEPRQPIYRWDGDRYDFSHTVGRQVGATAPGSGTG